MESRELYLRCSQRVKNLLLWKNKIYLLKKYLQLTSLKNALRRCFSVAQDRASVSTGAVHFPGEASKSIPNGQEFAERLSGSFLESPGFPSWPSHEEDQHVGVPPQAILLG